MLKRVVCNSKPVPLPNPATVVPVEMAAVNVKLLKQEKIFFCLILTFFNLQVDASASGAGPVLIQEVAYCVEHPVSYSTLKFLKHQKSYSTSEKNALALLWAMQHIEVYLGSSAIPITVNTDHNPLTFLSNMSSSNQRFLHWALKLQDYNLQIQHIKGTDNIVVDALSRTGEMEF